MLHSKDWQPFLPSTAIHPCNTASRESKAWNSLRHHQPFPTLDPCPGRTRSPRKHWLGCLGCCSTSHQASQSIGSALPRQREKQSHQCCRLQPGTVPSAAARVMCCPGQSLSGSHQHRTDCPPHSEKTQEMVHHETLGMQGRCPTARKVVHRLGTIAAAEDWLALGIG